VGGVPGLSFPPQRPRPTRDAVTAGAGDDDVDDAMGADSMGSIAPTDPKLWA